MKRLSGCGGERQGHFCSYRRLVTVVQSGVRDNLRDSLLRSFQFVPPSAASPNSRLKFTTNGTRTTLQTSLWSTVRRLREFESGQALSQRRSLPTSCSTDLKGTHCSWRSNHPHELVDPMSLASVERHSSTRKSLEYSFSH